MIILLVLVHSLELVYLAGFFACLKLFLVGQRGLASVLVRMVRYGPVVSLFPSDYNILDDVTVRTLN